MKTKEIHFNITVPYNPKKQLLKTIPIHFHQNKIMIMNVCLLQLLCVVK